MRPRGGPPGPRRRGSAALLLLLLAASAWLYSALLVLYPQAFRRRYSEEMRRDFRELMREGLEEGGAKELVRVWAQAHSDLVLTALKERSTLLARRYASYSSVDPRIAKRAAVRAMVAVVLVAVCVGWWTGLFQTPTYESSAQVLVAQKQADQQTYVTRSGEEIQPLPPSPSVEKLQELTQTMVHAIESRTVAEEVIQRLGLQMKPDELLDNLTVEQIEGTSFIRLTYEDSDPMRAHLIVNTVGKVSEHISPISAVGSTFTATVWDKATLPLTPVSPKPLRNGLLTLVMGLVLCVGTALALPSVAASIAGTLGRPAVPQGVGQAGLPGGWHGGPSQAYVIKDYVIMEKELLEALGRWGKLTAVEAALESSLSVAEAERMLQDLAAKGHLEVTVEHGRLYYAIWDRDAPL
jgi:capsular polysaccharide biosynthesis protein